MTKEDKELLLKDLCARLSYGIKISPKEKDTGEYDISGGRNYMYPDVIEVEAFIPDGDNTRIEYGDWIVYLDNIQLYLRPMSSMTEEEKKKYKSFFWNHHHEWDGYTTCTECIIAERLQDFLEFAYSHHFDYRGLIEKGLALEATEGMYNEKEK